MKICLINNLYKPYQRGGAERVIELITQGLKSRGYDVLLITTCPINRKPTTCLDSAGQTKNQRQKIFYVRALYYNLNFLPKFLRLFWHIIDMFDIGSYLVVKKILKKEKPDLVMTHNLKGIGYLIPRAIKSLNIKHIHTLHDIQLLHPSGLMIYGKEKQVNNIFAKVYANVCKGLFNSPDIIISPSNWLFKMHQDRGFFIKSRQATLINPTLISSAFITSREKESVFRFVYIGQVEEHKGILFLIKVFKMLCEDLENGKCQLIIIGDGLKLEQAKKLSVNEDKIRFLGKIKHKDLQIEMEQFNALIVPSLCYENSPTVIYEALNTGLPVIASAIGGIPELVNNTAGILFKPGNSNDLMQQMKWAIEHKDELEKISKLGREKIKQYSLDNYIKKLEDMIK